MPRFLKYFEENLLHEQILGEEPTLFRLFPIQRRILQNRYMNKWCTVIKMIAYGPL